MATQPPGRPRDLRLAIGVLIAALLGLWVLREGPRAPGSGLEPKRPGTPPPAEVQVGLLGVEDPARTAKSDVRSIAQPGSPSPAPDGFETLSVFLLLEDARAHDRVPWYPVRVSQAAKDGRTAWSAEYTSDEDGGKLVLNIDPDREVRLKLGDPETGTETLNLHFGMDRDPVRIPCPVGPTLLLDLELPAGYGYEDLVAGLQDPSDRFEALRPKPASSGSVHPPHEDADPAFPWVRFGRNYRQAQQSWLTVTTRDGRYRAETDCTAYGFVRKPVKLRLRPSTTLRGRILAAQGIDGALELQPADARVRIVQVVNEEQGEHPKAMEAECDEQGRFLFSDVPTGQWELGATDIDWACGTAKFSVHPGPNDLGDLVLEPRGPECTLRGTILFDPGALDLAFCVVSATPLANKLTPSKDELETFLVIEEGTPGRATFAIEGVSTGPCWLAIQPNLGIDESPVGGGTTLGYVAVADPTLPVEIDLRGQYRGIGFQFATGEGSDAESEVDIFVRSNGNWSQDGSLFFNGASIATSPANDFVVLLGRSKQTLIDFGTIQRAWQNAGDANAYISVPSLNQVGPAIEVIDAESGRRLTGVPIFHGTETLGTTGPHGLLLPSIETNPASLTVPTPGYDPHPTTFRPRGGHVPVLQLHLRRKQD